MVPLRPLLPVAWRRKEWNAAELDRGSGDAKSSEDSFLRQLPLFSKRT